MPVPHIFHINRIVIAGFIAVNMARLIALKKLVNIVKLATMCREAEFRTIRNNESAAAKYGFGAARGENAGEENRARKVCSFQISL